MAQKLASTILASGLLTGCGMGNHALHPVAVNGMYGYIDHSGKVLIQPQFSLAGKFSEGLAPVQPGSMWGFIDSTGKCDPRPVRPGRSFSPKRTGTGWHGRQGWLHPEEWAVQVKPQLRRRRRIRWLGSRYRVNKQWGYINPMGTFVIQPRFDEAGSFSERRAVVRIGVLDGYIDRTRKVVISPRYEVR